MGMSRKKIFLRKVAIVLASLLIFLTVTTAIFIFSVWIGWFGKIPDSRQLANIENHLSSEIYAQDGRLLGKYFIFDRSHAEKEQISVNVFNSLIATEDARFYDHKGIDYRSLARVVIRNFIMGQRSAGGGSTIHQQLAKNLFSRENNGMLSMPVSKVREMIIANRLERVYSKQDILVIYLNTVPFGENVFGISAASLRFFNKNPIDLTIQEAAVLVGMLKGSTLFNPRLYPERALGRRNVVIGQLAKYGYISYSDADSLSSLPLQINYNPITHNQGPAPYFRETLRKQVSNIINEYNELHQIRYNLYTDGLKIYTTIDYDLQLMAESSMARQVSSQQKIMDSWYARITPSDASRFINTLIPRTHRFRNMQNKGYSENEIRKRFHEKQVMEMFSWDGPERVEISPFDSIFRQQKIVHSSMISIDPSTAKVKAWVGGIDYRFFQYDHALAKRQAGSTFKPFLYATALHMGIDPCEFISNERQVYEDYDNWSPANANNDYEGFYSMMGALANSVNTISAHYIHQTGVVPVIEIARKCGISSPLPNVPSLALGTAELSLLELTAAYIPFANSGKTGRPFWLLRIEDKKGRVLYDHTPARALKEAISPETAAITQEMLKAVIESGTGRSLRGQFGLTGHIAGKTGTTQNNADTWFIGFSPNLVTGVWTGLENPAFAQMFKAPISSTSGAVPIWGDYYKSIQDNQSTRKYTNGYFPLSNNETLAMLDCALYLDELPKDNFWDRIFSPSERTEEGRKSKRDEDRRGNRLKRWLERLFD